MNIDLESLLDYIGVPYRTHGKNISPGWLGVSCPFCMGKGHHLGINREGLGFYCWQCGEKGHLIRIIQEVQNESKSKSWTILKQFALSESDPSAVGGNPNSHMPLIRAEMPLRREQLTKCASDYLTSRSFKLGAITGELGVYEAKPPSPFEKRLIIPITYKKQEVTFTARDYTGKREPKYLNCPKEKSIIPIRSTLYGIDDAHPDCAILVEGPTDRWRLGKETMALMGKTISDNQVRQLFERRFKYAFVILDSNEDEASEKIVGKIKALFKEVRIVSLSEGDPGSLSNDQASKLVKELTTRFFYI